MFLTIKKIPKKSWSSKNPFNLKPKLITIFFLVFGLILFGAGEGLLIVSFTGAAPWSVLAQGISLKVNLILECSLWVCSNCAWISSKLNNFSLFDLI